MLECQMVRNISDVYCVTSHVSMSSQLKDQVVFQHKVYKWVERKRRRVELCSPEQ